VNSSVNPLEIRFQADANLGPDIVRGQRREPTLDYRSASSVIPDGMSDPEVLELCAAAGRVLVTADIRTMPRHFLVFIAARDSPGLILIPRGLSIGEVIQGNASCLLSWTAEEMRNQSRWLLR
jgi:hypothetical protein